MKTKPIAIEDVVRDALDAAKADCLTGYALEAATARGVIAEMGPERFGATADEVADVFRAVVWPETRTEANPWWKGGEA
jgi:hypothetical protein